MLGLPPYPPTPLPVSSTLVSLRPQHEAPSLGGEHEAPSLGGEHEAPSLGGELE